MIVPPFVDPGVRAAFAEEGYAVFPGLAAPALDALRAVYRDMLSKLEPADPYFRHAMTGTIYVRDRALRREVTDRVGALVAPLVASLLGEHRFLGAGFRVKLPGPDSALTVHGDPTMVDEDRDWSMNIIAPIVETGPANGALQIVPGSHRLMPKVRSLDLADREDVVGRSPAGGAASGPRFDQAIAPAVRLVPLRAGDAILYFNSLLHGSGPNTSGAPRPVVLGTLLSPAAPMTLYLHDRSRSVVERYEVPDDYFGQLEDFDRDFRLRPTVGRRLDDIGWTPDRSRDELITGILRRA